MKVRVELFTEWGALAQYEKQWQELLRLSDANQIVSSWSFNEHWWNSYRGFRIPGESRKKLLVGLVWLDDGQAGSNNMEELAAILPFYHSKQTVNGIYSLDTIQLLGQGGDGSPDFLGVICKQGVHGLMDEIIQVFFRKYTKWDRFIFKDVLNNQSNTVFMASLAHASGVLMAESKENTLLYADLSEGWESYSAKLSSNRRNRLKKWLMNFSACGGEIERLSPEANKLQIESWYNDLVRLHRKRWQGRRGGSFASVEYREFHKRLIKTLQKNGELCMLRAKLDGQVIGVYYGMIDSKSAYYYQSGLDPDYLKYRQGYLLIFQAIKSAYETGCGTFEMLKGDYDFKRSLAKNTKITKTQVVYHKTWRSLVFKYLKDIKKVLYMSD